MRDTKGLGMRNVFLLSGMLGLALACAPASARGISSAELGPLLQPVPEALLDGAWRVTEVGGRQAVAGTTPEVRFDGTRISGDTGCNSFGGGFRLERGYLTTSTLITTRRACQDRIANQERSLLTLLGQRLNVSQRRSGRLVMTNRGGQTLVLAKR